MDGSHFSPDCTTIKTLALQTKTPIDYAEPVRAISYRKHGEVGREVEINAVGKINLGRMTTVHGFPRMSFTNYQGMRERSELRILSLKRIQLL
eukprot:12905805-Ditylum_brightwellii.AAC.1